MCVRVAQHTPPAPARACTHTLTSVSDRGQAAGAHTWPRVQTCSGAQASTNTCVCTHTRVLSPARVLNVRKPKRQENPSVQDAHECSCASMHAQPHAIPVALTHHIWTSDPGPEQQLLLHPTAMAPCSMPWEGRRGSREALSSYSSPRGRAAALSFLPPRMGPCTTGAHGASVNVCPARVAGPGLHGRLQQSWRHGVCTKPPAHAAVGAHACTCIGRTCTHP